MRKIFRFTVIAFGILVMVMALIDLDPFLVFMGAAYLFLMHKIVNIRPERYREYSLATLKRDLFIWSFFPLSLGALGTTGIFDVYFFFVFIDLAYTTLIAVFAFMIVINLNYYTDLRPDRPLSVLFVIIFTVGGGALMGITRYFSDLYFGTIYLGGNTYMMAYLIMVSILSVSIGFNIEDYICSYKFFPLKDLSADREIKNTRRRFLHTLNKLFGKYDHGSLRVLSWILQAGIALTVVYGVYLENWSIVYWSVFSLIASLSPDLFRIHTGIRAPAIIYLWIAVVTFVFAFGRPMGFYVRYDNWAGITHCLTGTLMGVLVFSWLVNSQVSKRVYLPNNVMILMVLLAIFPIGILWEIAEFYVDVIFDKNLQAGLTDTVHDILCNFGGTVISLFALYLLKGFEGNE